jgi:exopolysaccharide production protein ExoZ
MHQNISPPTTIQQLNSIQILRGIAALAVVAMHVSGHLFHYRVEPTVDLLWANGGAGVYLFFVISGFIIAHVTGKGINAREFVVKRAMRILPLFYVAFVLLLAINGFNYPWQEILKSALLLPGDAGSMGPYFDYPILTVAWTLTYEVYFYALFLVAGLINHRFRTLIAGIAIIAIVYVGQALVYGSAQTTPDTPPYQGAPLIKHMVFLVNPIMLMFVLGLLAESIYSAFTPNSSWQRRAVRDLAPITAIVSCWGLLTYGAWMGDLGWGLPSFGLVLSLSLLEKSGVTFNFRPLVFLGAISYSIYLFHPLVIQLTGPSYFSHFWQDGFTKFAITIALTIAVANLTFRYIEKPSQLAARALLSRRSSLSTAPPQSHRSDISSH